MTETRRNLSLSCPLRPSTRASIPRSELLDRHGFCQGGRFLCFHCMTLREQPFAPWLGRLRGRRRVEETEGEA